MRIVIKLSGKVLEKPELRRSLGSQVSRLQEQGHQVAVVHGGGKQLTAYCRVQGIPVRQVQGRRITDEATIEAARMVFAAVNSELTISFLSEGVRAVGISAFDGFLTRSRRRAPLKIRSVEGSTAREEEVDFGLVGDIEAVDPGVVAILWKGTCVPVISCLCATAEGETLNVNADTVAAELALSLKADRLIAVSDVDGIYRDPTDPATRMPQLSLQEAKEHLSRDTFRDGMIPKVQTAVRTLEQGLPCVQILSGLGEDSILKGLSGSAGTLLTR